MEARRTTFSVAKLNPSPEKTPVFRRITEPPVFPSKNETLYNRTTLDSSRKHTGERVKVFVRVRPTKSGSETPGALALNPEGTGLAVLRNDIASEFSFDCVLGPSATQADVYEAAAAPVVADVLQGYNATLLAYGQTGAGKTHTLSSISPESVGIIPRAASELFSAIAADTSNLYSIHMSYLQIYCEALQDLLCPESGDNNLQIREGPDGWGGTVYVPGLKHVEISSLDECLRLLQLGNRNRSVAFTALNAHSSRSHAVVMLTVVKRQRSPHGGGEAPSFSPPKNPHNRKVQVGKLFMVDLAGSERLKKSKSIGQRAAEARAINLSLTNLGMCVNAIAQHAQYGTAGHVPFRDSKLTRLLQESLGGNARTSLVVAVSDAKEHADETLQSLQFGARAMNVQTHAFVNEKYLAEFSSSSSSSAAADSSSALLERSLLERENELESVQSMLVAEQERSRQVMESLDKERAEAQALAAGIAAEHEKAMREEHAARAALHDRATAAEKVAEEVQKQRARDVEILEAELEAARAEAAESRVRVVQEQHAVFEQKMRSWEVERNALIAEHGQEIQAWKARLAEAHTTAACAAERAAAELSDVRQQWSAEKEAAAQLHASRVSEIEAEKNRAADELESAKRECQILQAEVERTKKIAEAELIATAERLQRETKAWEQRLRDSMISVEAKEREAVELRGSMRRLELSKAQARAAVKQLEDRLEASKLEVLEYKSLADDLFKRFHAAQDRATTAETSRAALAATILQQRRLHNAARVIQRAWRAYSMQRQRVEGYAALYEAQSALGTLAAQHAELESRRHANLAFAGQTLVAESVGVLHEAVEGLLSTFLLPSKDLKAVQKFHRKKKSGAAAMLGFGKPRALMGGGNDAQRTLPLCGTHIDGGGGGRSREEEAVKMSSAYFQIGVDHAGADGVNDHDLPSKDEFIRAFKPV